MSFDVLIRHIQRLEGALVDVNRRMNNIMREGRVLEVDGATGMAIVEAQDGRTAPVPWLQRAGTIRDWDPPTAGERVLLISPNGDPARGMILPGGYSQSFGQPHNQLGQAMRQIGDGTDLFTGDQRVITNQLIVLRGSVRIEGPLEIEGPGVTHNNRNIGASHVHGGVVPGGGDTGGPH